MTDFATKPTACNKEIGKKMIYFVYFSQLFLSVICNKCRL